MAKLTPPCRDCTERRVGCHGTCPRYQEYHERNVQIGQARAAERRLNSALVSGKVRQKWQAWKKTEKG